MYMFRLDQQKPGENTGVRQSYFLFQDSERILQRLLVFATGEKIKSELAIKLWKMCLRGQGQSVIVHLPLTRE